MTPDIAPVIVNSSWCKGCEICVRFCPKKVLEMGSLGKAVVVRPEDCSLCENCELLCPDFAITVTGTRSSKVRTGGGERE